MPTSGYFDVVFAVDGDLTPVPDDVQPDGSISYAQGWGPYYSQDPTVDPGTALFIDRAQTNQLFFDVTSAIQYIQQNGAAPFISSAMNGGSPYSYRKGVTVSYDAGSGVQNWISQVAANTSVPGADANWLELPADVGVLFTGGTSSGSANAQTVTTTQGGWDATAAGNIITWKAGFSNTGPFTLNGDGDGATAVKKMSASGLVDLAQGDVVVGGEYVALTDGTTIQLINPTLGGSRQRLAASTTFYVATTGNDSTGTGAAGFPWLTLQHAYDYIQANVDIAGQTCAISVADGTYAAGIVATKATVGGVIQVTGNATTPANCIVSSASDNCFTASGVGTALLLKGFKTGTTASGINAVNAIYGGQITINGLMEYGAVASGNAHLIATFGGLITVQNDYTISGAFFDHYSIQHHGTIYVRGVTVTITGTPAAAHAFCFAQNVGMIYAAGVTYSGSATGTRYSLLGNAVAFTNGAGASYFPGNSAGSTASGGQYL